MANKIRLWLGAAVLCVMTTALADTGNPEINYLLTEIGGSSCQFVRNGKVHSPTEAEDHLSMKYSRAKRHIDSAEDFIDRLATASSWTDKIYIIRCPDTGDQPSAEWLYSKLENYRTTSGSQPQTR